MGNKIENDSLKENQLENNLEFIKKLTDERYGEIKLMRIKDSEEIIAIKTKIVTKKQEQMQILESAEKRQQLDLPTIIRLLKIDHNEINEYCSKFFKIHFVYEYLEQTLEDEILRRANEQEFFTEIELLNILDCVLSALLCFNQYNITHEDVRPHSIFFSPNSGVYKLNDVQFMSDLNHYKQMQMGSSEACFLSPELFFQLSKRNFKPQVDIQKSDIFSLGMTLLEASCLESVERCYDFDQWVVHREEIDSLLKDAQTRYSELIINLISDMTTLDSDLRPDFEQVLEQLSTHQNNVKQQDQEEIQKSPLRYTEMNRNSMIEKVQDLDLLTDQNDFIQNIEKKFQDAIK